MDIVKLQEVCSRYEEKASQAEREVDHLKSQLRTSQNEVICQTHALTHNLNLILKIMIISKNMLFWPNIFCFVFSLLGSLLMYVHVHIVIF